MDTANITTQGIAIVVLGMGVVFASLVVISIVFQIFNNIHRRKEEKAEQSVPITHKKMTKEQLAAVMIALHLYNEEVEEYGKQILTYKKLTRSMSPWKLSDRFVRNRKWME